MLKQYMVRCSTLFAVSAAVLMSNPSHAVDMNLSPVPLFVSPAVAPLNMLVVGRDHKLYYEAYNDASDLNGDGRIDAGYKGYLPNPTAQNPTAGGIDYYGYFDSYKCYTYANNLFSPASITANKRCTGAWSGDYLNYLTMSRIDALRKVLYGGKREVDTASQTVLVRSHIPMDAHSWGKEVSDNEPFDISQFTPYSTPTADTRHLFANTTPNDADADWTVNTGPPRLRVLLNSPYRIWEWVSKESPVAGNEVAPPSGEVSIVYSAEFNVRVEACVSAALIGSESCKRYPNGNYKPFGLLHEFGENNSMLFGLLSGSYTANKSGGVLRKNMGTITDEIDSNDGRLTNVTGIIKTLDNFRVAAYTRYTGNGGTDYDCGLPDMARGAPTDGSCRMWGNPVAEMMYETLRYFRGMSPTGAFTATYGGDNTTVETTLGLPRPTWQNPYTNRPVCAKPFQTVMADINNSYDSDQLPGTLFTLETGSTAIDNVLPNLNVGTLAQTITGLEFPSGVGLRFIGHSGADYDGAPTAKTVTSLANIRGLAPEEPTKQGSYYSASVAYHGFTNDMSTSATGEQKVQTFAVALASPLPRIEIPVGSGASARTITLVPFAKSVKYNNEIGLDEGDFQPTNQIVDFYVENLADDRTSGTFQVNFEDVEAGNDHDMDAIARYSYRVVGNTVQVDVSSDYEAGGIIHHIGYVISGTSADGVYLVVQDCNKTAPAVYNCNDDDPDYFLDTPTGEGPGGDWDDDAGLPGFSSRTFSPGTSGTATLLKDPLWYAAKWGGFTDSDGDNRPNLRSEWDTDRVNTPGYDKPDNYFLVTNALTLSQQLRAAFNEILGRSTSASSASVNSGSISTDTRIYQARFDTRGWTGQLLSYGVDPRTGALNPTPLWDASVSPDKLPTPGARRIYTVNSNDAAVPFTWNDLDATRRLQLSSDAAAGQIYVDYLRGDTSHEARYEPNGLRNRPTSVLGDIVNSAPLYVGAPRARYSDSLEPEPYSAFVASRVNRNAVIYVGANDGMLHAFDAGGLGPDPDGAGPQTPQEDGNGGVELFAFIPKTVFGNLTELTRPSYTHRYFVDGAPNSADVYINNDWRTVLIGGLNLGGQGIYALDVTDPGSLGANSFLWEVNDRVVDANGLYPFRDLGYTYSQPAIVRLQDGTWAAVFGNGYNNTVNDGVASTTGNAVLYVVDIETGTLLRKFDTGVGMTADPSGTGRPNGMATPTMVDIDGDRVVDHAYVGDLFGNMWKIDMRSTNPAQWDFAFGTAGAPEPFFIAKDGVGATANRQPITVRAEVARGPYGVGVMVLFGTGKFLEPTDQTVQPVRPQTFYGLVDANSYTATDQITTRADLTAQTIQAETEIDPDFDPDDPTYEDADPDNNYLGRTTSSNNPMGRGWYLDLLSPPNPPGTYAGERSVTDPLVRDDRVIFTTLSPSDDPTSPTYDPTTDPCDRGGSSWLMVLDLLSGKRLTDAQLDTNGDNVIDEDDLPVSGVSSDEILSRPAGLLCLTNDCQADRLMSSGTSGSMDERALKSLGGARGRQSWRQIR
jgi:type IV pilus assembly protein PilY1